MKKLFIIPLFLFLCFSSHAAFTINTTFNYSTSTDSKDSISFGGMSGHLFLGASLDSKQTFYFGQNVSYLSTEYKNTTSTKIGTLELGPRFVHFLNDDKNWFWTGAWNPYAKGTKTTTVSATISGSSFLLGFGYELKINKNFHLGASFNYYALSVSKSTVGTTESEVSDSYSSMMPMISMSIHFK